MIFTYFSFLEDHLPNSTHDIDRSMAVVNFVMFFI